MMFRPGPVVTGYPLMDPATPFTVKVPYRMAPDMQLLEDRPLLAEDRHWHDYINLKAKMCQPVYAQDWDCQTMYKVLKRLAEMVPNGPVKFRGNQIEWPWIESTGDSRMVEFLSLSLQEDFVVWTRNRAGNLAAQALSVTFPSGWAPEEKAGMTFDEIHVPLKDADLLKKAGNHIAAMICTKGPFLRHVWSVANTGDLNRHPKKYRAWTNETLDDMWFRCERQVTIPVDDDTALFLIRVYVTPLRRVIEFEDKKNLIKESVNSMSDAILEYKGMNYFRDWINQQP